MSYEAKTDWQHGDIVAETDLNRIEQGVADAHTKFNVPGGHGHTGVDGDAPKIDSSGLADGAATDLVIGNRTIDDSIAVGTVDTDTLTRILSKYAAQLRAFAGSIDWWAAPATTLATIAAKLGQSLNTTDSPTFAKVTLAADPVNGLDAATKQYVDAVKQGLDIKDSVRVATTANITLSGTQTIDGVAVTAGNRVLVKNQSTASQNGIYVVAAGSWSRAADADTSAKVTSGMYVFVSEGSTQAANGYVLTTPDPITLGTTSLVYTQFSGAGQIVAGNGLTKTGNQLDVQVDGATLEIVSDTLRLKDAGITDAKIAAGAAIAQSKISGLVAALAAKAPLDSPSFTTQASIPKIVGITDTTVVPNLNADMVDGIHLRVSGGILQYYDGGWKNAMAMYDKSAMTLFGAVNGLANLTSSYQTLLSLTGKGYLDIAALGGATSVVTSLRIKIDGVVIFEGSTLGNGTDIAALTTRGLLMPLGSSTTYGVPSASNVNTIKAVSNIYAHPYTANAGAIGGVAIAADSIYFASSLLIEAKCASTASGVGYYYSGGYQ